MDAFEQLVGEILWMEGYWVRTSVKVELTSDEKKRIGRPSSPRWELDIVAYSGRENLIRVIECKSYLDSLGVQASGFQQGSKNSERYKLFNDPVLRRTVINRLRRQFYEVGACPQRPSVRLGLACGKIKDSNRSWIKRHFKNKGWDLWDEVWLRDRLKKLAARGYENQVSAVVAKLLLRGELSASGGRQVLGQLNEIG